MQSTVWTSFPMTRPFPPPNEKNSPTLSIRTVPALNKPHSSCGVSVRRGVALSRIEGRWWAAAIAAATLAGILLLNAGRQLAITRAGGDWYE